MKKNLTNILLVVILLVVLSAPVVREKLASLKKTPATAAKEVA